jgi:hypothetical protein
MEPMNAARLAVLGMSLFSLVASLWFWGRGIGATTLTRRRLAVFFYGLAIFAVVIAQLVAYRNLARVPGRIEDPVVTAILVSELAFGLVLAFFWAYRKHKTRG